MITAVEKSGEEKMKTAKIRKSYKIGGFVLAGGESTRLGFDKCMIEINGKRLIEIVTDKLSSIFSRVIIIAKDAKKFERYEVWTDILPIKAAISGLHTILSLSTYNWNFVTACDMPFINRNLIRYIESIALSYDYREIDAIIPFINGYFEPLFAVYSRNAYSKLCRFIDKGNRSLQRFIKKIEIKEICEDSIRIHDPNLVSFFNINTPIDLISMNELEVRKNKH